mmetsp:Transcript_18095/g.27142  ORF Transcript_18095/g.27142 Transcript_18095/m.27142 type:complete len:333 (-) Transcript_18095:174-1172(-)
MASKSLGLDSLPKETLLNVFLYQDEKSLANSLAVNKLWKSLIDKIVSSNLKYAASSESDLKALDSFLFLERNAKFVFQYCMKKIELKEIPRFSELSFRVQGLYLRRESKNLEGLNSYEMLERGIHLIGMTRDPTLDIKLLIKFIDEMAAKVRERIEVKGAKTLIEKIDAIKYVMYNEFGFHQPSSFYAEENNLIQYVIKNRTGQPITLSIVFILVAHRVHLNAWGCNTPRTFMCGISETDEKSEKYYVDAFDFGQVHTMAEALNKFLREGIRLPPAAFDPADPFSILRRMLANLQNSRQYHTFWSDPERLQERGTFEARLHTLLSHTLSHTL